MQPSTVLLVEDDIGHARLIQRYLRRGPLEAELVHVENGADALGWLHAHAGEGARVLVLLDINMPAMDGVQVLDAIRAAPALRSIPVIMLTTADEEHEVARCYDHGCSAYVVKPVDYGAFVQTVERLGEWMATIAVPETGGAHGAGAVHRG